MLTVVLLAVSIAGLSVGSVHIPVSRLPGILTGEGTGVEQTILLDIRLPRIILAILVGAGLSVAGVVFQALLRNPLAEPYILGISSGGTVGTLLALWAFAGVAAVAAPVAAFAGCLAVTALVFMLGHRHGELDTYALLLAGVMVGAFFNAVVLVAFSMVNQDMRSAFLLLMGNLSGAGSMSLLLTGPLIVGSSLYLVLRARDFNLIATGDETASHLGVDVARLRRISYVLASLVTGVAVSLSGIIGFVGLIIPHICRMWLGPDHRLLLPASFIAGATFLVAADILSRTVIAPAEIPVGAVTAAIGAPLFIYLLRRG
jgi:iron complex transport system permease protein